MKKIITYLILVIFIIAGILFFLTRVPAVQDALFQRLAQNLISTAPNIFPEEDSLSALVCGSKSPLPHPTRAETCVMIKAGDETFIFDVGNKSIDNLRNWRVPLNQLNSIFIFCFFFHILALYIKSDQVRKLNNIISKTKHFMKLALIEAKKAEDRGEVPVGALIIDQNNNIISFDGNKVNRI